MEIQLRAALLDWLASDPQLSALNGVGEESPLAVSEPWLGIAASASVDWSTKDRLGREVRIALELATRGDLPDSDAALSDAVELSIAALPAAQSGFTIVNSQFLRARARNRGSNLRAMLLEYRFRILANP